MNLTKRFIITNMLGHPICKLRRFLYKSPKSISFNTQPSTKLEFKIILYFSIFEPLGLNEDNDMSDFSIVRSSRNSAFSNIAIEFSIHHQVGKWAMQKKRSVDLGQRESRANILLVATIKCTTFSLLFVRWRDFYPLLTFQSISNSNLHSDVVIKSSCK